MTNPPGREIDPEVQARRKRQIWLIVLVMTASACTGVLVLLGILWLLRDYLSFM